MTSSRLSLSLSRFVVGAVYIAALTPLSINFLEGSGKLLDVHTARFTDTKVDSRRENDGFAITGVREGKEETGRSGEWNRRYGVSLQRDTPVPTKRFCPLAECAGITNISTGL